MRTALTRADRYSVGSIWFHWIIAALVVFNLIVGIFRESVPALKALMPAHMAVGITVLALTILRIGWRLAHPAPPFPATMPIWERGLAKTVRTVFYALLLLMPLSGWTMISAGKHPHPISWFGLFNVPVLPVSHAVQHPAGLTHAVLGYSFAVLVLLHIAGALRHHFILRDAILARMIPGAAPRA